MTNFLKKITSKFNKESIKNFFYGPTFNIHKKNVDEHDPLQIVVIISMIFSFAFSVIFLGGFTNFFNVLKEQLLSILFINSELGFSTKLSFSVMTFGSIILAIFGSIYINKKKRMVSLYDAIGVVFVFGTDVYVYFATKTYNVTSSNWFLYLIFMLPTFVFLFASCVNVFRFFYKLLSKKQIITSIKEQDYIYRRQYEKDIFRRMWNYFKANFGQVLTIAALIFLALAVLYPFVILLMRSINDPIADMKNPFGLPTTESFDNYAVIWDYVKDAFVNSLVTTIGVTLGTMICASLLAYSFIRFNFRGKSFLYFAIIGLMMIPGILTLISRYQLCQQLGLIDDGYQDIITRFKIYGGIILPGIAGYIPMSFMLLFTFFKGIPHDLFEAADVDGASNFGVFLKIVIPLSKPILSTIAIQTFVGEWNDYLWANLVHGNDGASATLPVILQTLSKQAEVGAIYYSVVFAGYVLSAIPLVLIFIVASKQFIEGLTSGAFKM